MPRLQAIEWVGGSNGFLRLLDQTELPTRLVYRDCHSVEDVYEAIRALRVRGAPALGVAGALGLVLWAQDFAPRLGQSSCPERAIEQPLRRLDSTRPTAVNLRSALLRMQRRWCSWFQGPQTVGPVAWMLAEALAIAEEDRQMCAAIGRHGASLVPASGGVLTHCNTGFLATAGDGTALAILYAAAAQGKLFHVYVDETRPLLQGSRLTAWELQQRGLQVTLLCDSMAAQVMKEGKVQLVLVGADRIAANGDTANKIGTYGLAVLAQAHGIPFYVAAPSTTFDLNLPDGADIPIEQRDPREVIQSFGRQTAPDGVAVYNPAFDVTPARLITGIITEKGLIRPITPETIRACLNA